MKSIEEIKAMFEQEREQASQYVVKPITDKPAQPGSYNIQIDGIMTFLPIFMEFDGKDWVDLNSTLNTYLCDDLSRVVYYDRVKPEIENTIKKVKP